MNGPIGVVAVGADKKTLAVTDYNNHRVQIVTTEGVFIRQIGNGLSGAGPNQFNFPNAICVMCDGATLVVADYANHRLQILNVDGTFLKQIGNGQGAGLTQFNSPMGVCVSWSTLLVATDGGNNRLQVLQ